jgi:hypothetical protein
MKKKNILDLLTLVLCTCILCSRSALFKWERCAQFLVLLCAIQGCKGHILAKVFTTPLYFYTILAILIEATQLHHEKVSQDMFATWNVIEKLRERADLEALYTIMLKRKNLHEDKVLGKQWLSYIIEHLPPQPEAVGFE